MSYHHPRHWRHDPSDRWRAVGVDNQALAPWCEAVAAGRVASVQVKLANGQVVTVRRSDRATWQAAADNAQRLRREYLREAVAHVPSAFAAIIERARASLNKPCTLGVGCDEYGTCYAAAHGEPDRCGKS